MTREEAIQAFAEAKGWEVLPAVPGRYTASGGLLPGVEACFANQAGLTIPRANASLPEQFLFLGRLALVINSGVGIGVRWEEGRAVVCLGEGTRSEASDLSWAAILAATKALAD